MTGTEDGMVVIGHGGASALAPANTIRSFDLALEAGVDMIEFDVRSRRGVLMLEHGVLPSRGGPSLSLDVALAHFQRSSFSRVGLNVDLKAPGYEREALAALRAHGLTDRILVSSQFPAVIDRVRCLDGGVPTAISVGGPIARLARRWTVRGWREAVCAGLRSGRFGDLMLHHRHVDAELMAAIGRAGRRVYAWTVDDADAVGALSALGVAGVVTGDPAALGDRRGAARSSGASHAATDGG